MQSKWRLSHARGYLGLGMVAEAEAELNKLEPTEREDFEVLSLRAVILQEQKRWPAMQSVSAMLVARQPEDPGWWTLWAYAARRAESLVSAVKILSDAEILHPNDPTIQFNLGCYACQRGDLARARRHVDRAIALDDSFRDTAATDSDLAPLREAQAAE